MKKSHNPRGAPLMLHPRGCRIEPNTRADWLELPPLTKKDQEGRAPSKPDDTGNFRCPSTTSLGEAQPPLTPWNASIKEPPRVRTPPLTACQSEWGYAL